jgi:cellulose synthase/poly-beta-1,6-N-acetylglucosamine synthase-like glycosyltransferase
MPFEHGLVSIVVPVHNKEKARICGEHVRKQTYPNIELILVDFKGFPAEKRNYGYLKSKGEYVLFLDEDSYLSPSAISACVNKFKQEFDVVGIPAVKAEPKGYLAKCISVTRLGGAELKFFRRSVLQDVGLFHPEYALSDDLDLFVRVFRKGYRLGMVDREEGYMVHDETNQLGSVLRKILFARKPYKNLQEEYGQTLDALTRKPTERKRILKILSEEPILVPGVSFVMLVSFLARRIP